MKNQIKSLLQESPKQASHIFFKTGVGEYAEHDKFIGISVPNLRKIAKSFADLPFAEIQDFIKSPINEERLLALFILVGQYKTGDDKLKDKIYHFYIANLNYVNNWNLVDASAHLIIGDYLFEKDKKLLLDLAESENLWERRIAIISTLWFIRQNHFDWTIKIATILLNDKQDLIHKAVGWMLREVGKKDKTLLIDFLNQHASNMPRTMLRYSIEKFSVSERKDFLNL